MKDHISDEELGIKLRELMKASAADETLVKDIADSPTLWWNIQRTINEKSAPESSPWPPVNTWLRWLAFGIPAMAAAAILISFLLARPAASPEPVATTMQPLQQSPAEPNVALTPPSVDQPVPAVSSPVVVPAKATKYRSVSTGTLVKKSVVRPARNSSPAAKPAAEIKTEFIALSYARDPESGQLVRVKVPSSMMVSLGLVESVKKPNDLVDAEVLVGDDGLTRAIRFIR